ncbi:hypothetical protein DYB28_011167, partial [Aphanomyces astaci]
MESIPVSSDHVDTCEADQAAVCIDLTEDDGIAPLPAFLWQDKSIRRVPEGWEFPAYPMDEMWFMWFCGDVDSDFRVLSPFRLLSTHDFDDAESQLRLEATQKRMFQLMEVLPLVMEGVTTADDLTVLARKDSPLESGLSPPADLNALVADLTPGEAPARSPPEQVVEASDVFNASGGAAVLPGILKSTELDYCSAPSSSDLGYAMSTAIPCRVMWKRWFIAERSSMRSHIRLVSRQDSGLSALSFQIVRNTMLWLARLYHDSTASMEASYFALVDMGPSGLDAAYDAALHRSVSHFHAPIDICDAHASVYAVHDMLAQVAPAKSSSLHGRCKSDAFFKFELFPSLSLCQVWLRWFGRGGGRQGGIPYGRWHDWEATRVSMDRLYHARRAVEAVAAIAIESRFVSSIADLETKSAGNLMDILEA